MIQHVGLEFEMPLTKANYVAADAEDVQKLYAYFIEKGWQPKYDPITKALVGVYRETKDGWEVVDSDVGICSLEVALPPFAKLEDAITHWQQFKSQILLPAICQCDLRVLGFGNQVLEAPLHTRLTPKGHIPIYFSHLLSEDVKEWCLNNAVGLCAAQFNFEIPKAKTLATLNTFLRISPLLWAATANDSIAGGKKLPYKSQRYYAFTLMSKGRCANRFNTPTELYSSLCVYINKAWSMPILAILREDRMLYPADQDLTTHQYIHSGQAKFRTLNGETSIERFSLDDLKSAIYFYWPTFKAKFRFKAISAEELVAIVQANDEAALLDVIDAIILEVRPIATQNKEEEINWLVFLYLLTQEMERVSVYVKDWDFSEVRKLLDEIQTHGLSQKFLGKNLGEIGLELMALIPQTESSLYAPYLVPVQQRFADEISPADEALHILDRQGLDTLLAHLTIR